MLPGYVGFFLDYMDNTVKPDDFPQKCRTQCCQFDQPELHGNEVPTWYAENMGHLGLKPTSHPF